MENYLTVSGEASAEYTEKRSRFIATISHCETEAAALAFINKMRSEYWDARHNVFAYSVEKGHIVRFSDDGEPHGTAGKPVLDVINGSGVTDIAIVVTRYFGGILLGTGGLVRAYSKSASDALAAANTVVMVPCTVLCTECEYSDLAKLTSLIEASGGAVEDTEYSDRVKLRFHLESINYEPFGLKLCEAFSARLSAEITENKVLPINFQKNS